MRSLASWAAQLCAWLLMFVAGAEVATRVDDWIRHDTPFSASPDFHRDLTVRDEYGLHGRPFGRHFNHRLNNAGFRGKDVAPRRAPGCTRVLVIGSSETYGSTESENKQYPAQLEDSLSGIGCYEVLNAGFAGMTLPTMTAMWERWGAPLPWLSFP